jgi:hypothetical protein
MDLSSLSQGKHFICIGLMSEKGDLFTVAVELIIEGEKVTFRPNKNYND